MQKRGRCRPGNPRVSGYGSLNLQTAKNNAKKAAKESVRAPHPEDLHRVYLRRVEHTNEVFDTLLSVL